VLTVSMLLSIYYLVLTVSGLLSNDIHSFYLVLTVSMLSEEDLLRIY
jgi:hypothetical protein